MEQLSLFDYAESVKARDEAITQVEANAEPAWKTACWTMIHNLACDRAELTTDQIWEALHLAEVEMPHENRAIGALMIRAAKEGWIVATDRYVNSERVACHRRPIRIWKSLIF